MSPTLALALAATAGTVLAQTDNPSDHVYRVNSGVDFEIANAGANSFLFSWTDSSGTFTDIEDPTLILVAGQTYTFARTTASHPMRITDDTLVLIGADGSYSRDTTDIGLIDAATLQPIADFTAEPPPSTDAIEWTLALATIGDYAYTCEIIFHTGMAGRIHVVNPCAPDLTNDGSVNTNDFFAYLAAYQAQDPTADFSGDGQINTNDFFAYLAAYQAGC